MQDNRHKRDVFFQYPLSRFTTSEGEIDLPILYFDDSVTMALFLVDRSKAAALVTDPELTVVPVLGGKALVGVAFYQYRHTAIGAYNEVGVAIAVAPQGVACGCAPLATLMRPLDKNPLGFHIIDLPVTTAAACSAGREVWGLPKFVTPIDFNLSGRRFGGAVQHPETGEVMLTLSGQARCAVPGPLLDLVLYSRHEQKLLRALVNTRGGARWMRGAGFMLRVAKEAQHPMAERLRALGLEQASPVAVCASDQLQLRLNAGAPVY